MRFDKAGNEIKEKKCTDVIKDLGEPPKKPKLDYRKYDEKSYEVLSLRDVHTQCKECAKPCKKRKTEEILTVRKAFYYKIQDYRFDSNAVRKEYQEAQEAGTLDVCFDYVKRENKDKSK